MPTLQQIAYNARSNVNYKSWDVGHREDTGGIIVSAAFPLLLTVSP